MVTPIDRDLRHTGNGEQWMFVGALHNAAQLQSLLGGGALRKRESVLKNRSQRREQRRNFRSLRRLRKLHPHLLQAFRHGQPGTIQTGRITKHHLHHRQTRLGRGPNQIHPSKAVHSRLDRLTDLMLDLLGGQTGRNGLNFNLRWCKWRKHIQRHLQHVDHAQKADQHGADQHKPSAGNRPAQNVVQQIVEHR